MSSPLALLDHRVIVGFHDCDHVVADRVLVTGEQRDRGKVTNPSVIGTFIHLGRCFDLTRSAATGALGAAYEGFRASVTRAGHPLPENRRGGGGGGELLLRDLDCAVLNFHLRDVDRVVGGGTPYYQTVRGVFVEGVPSFPGASIFTKTHTQVAVRDPSVIVGYFRPSRNAVDGA